MAYEVVHLILTIVDLEILCSYISERQPVQLEEMFCSRIFREEIIVSNDFLLIHSETRVAAVCG